MRRRRRRLGARNMLAKEMSSFVKEVLRSTPTAGCKTAEWYTEALVDICDGVEPTVPGEYDVLDSYAICNNARVCKCNDYFQSA